MMEIKKRNFGVTFNRVSSSARAARYGTNARLVSVFLVLIFLVLANFAAAQTVDNTLIINTESWRIEGDIQVKLSPLELGKAWGIELNVPGLLTGALNETVFLSSSLSFFKIDRHSEVVLPILVYKPTQIKKQVIHVDGIYRRFLGDGQEGIYAAGGLRYANVIGRSAANTEWNASQKTGLLAGIGYRHFHKRFYWGAGISGGVYLTGRTDLKGIGFNGGRYFVDAEFLKIGVLF